MAFKHLEKNQWIILALFVIATIFAIWASFYTIRNSKFFDQGKDDEPVILVDEDGEPNEEFYEAATEMTYEEIKEAAPEVVISPHLSVAHRKKALDEKTENFTPKNNKVTYTDDTIILQTAVISQGDIVTWKNNSSSTLTILGDSDWGNKIPMKPGGSHSQKFDYLGEYKYTIKDNPEASGVVIVGE